MKPCCQIWHSRGLKCPECTQPEVIIVDTNIVTNIKSRHWLNGGTALKNFSPNDEKIFIAAIEAYGNPNYVISHEPMDEKFSVKSDYSLHLLKRKPGANSSMFWETFRKIKEQNETTH